MTKILSRKIIISYLVLKSKIKLSNSKNQSSIILGSKVKLIYSFKIKKLH